jgi:hypothetical protein
MADTEQKPPYVILGIHGKDVETVEGNVARVRFFVNGKVVDENHELPAIAPGVPATLELYDMVMKHDLLKRYEALAGGAKK